MKKIDKYILQTGERLGKGSFAEVFKGKLVEGPGEFAIKVIEKKVLKQDEYLRSALFNEISIMKKVKSENVVRLEEVLETPNNYYIIQEFCNGGTLRDYLKKHARTLEPVAKQMLKHMLNGFLPLVKFGIIHRDLKPENILIHNGVLKIADFGFAKNLHNFERQMLESTVGTPLYMSPQILKEERYTSKSDVWSIGLIYFEVLHGVHPFVARNEKELLKKIETKKLDFDVDLSEGCRGFIHKCLAVNEDDRLSWDELYRHPHVAQYFSKYIEEEKKLEDRAKFIINKLRMKVHENNLDIEDLFQYVNSGRAGCLSKKELYKLLMSIDRTITKDEVIYIFNKFDEDGSGTIELSQFKGWMVANDIRVKPEARSFGPPMEEERERRAIEAIRMVKESVQRLKIDLLEFFKKFGKSGKEELDLEEFARMMLMINRDLKPDEIELIFAKFDVNGDKSVTFDEFKGLLYKITGRPVLDETFLRDLEDALKGL